MNPTEDKSLVSLSSTCYIVLLIRALNQLIVTYTDHWQTSTADYQNAGLAYSRWGDWLYDRYIRLKCSTDPNHAAYTTNYDRDRYSIITFCGQFFNLPTHAQALSEMKRNSKPRDNVYSLESQGTMVIICFAKTES